MGYKIYWKDVFGGIHNGESMSQSLAEAWITYLEEKYPDMKHWIGA